MSRIPWTFVLVEPGLPENVGAAARAVKTMGIGGLALVNPCDHLCARARWMAHGSEDVLEKAAVYDTLEEALEPVDISIATTARQRHSQHSCLDPHEIMPHLTGQGGVRQAALVFGSEASGLSNEALSRCDLLSAVPLAVSFPSLNLAQAVMVYAYALSHFQPSVEEAPESDVQGFAVLKRKIDLWLQITGNSENGIKERLFKRLALLNGQDLKLAHYVMKVIEKNNGKP